MLYQIDINPDVGAVVLREMIEEQLGRGPLADFCWKLFTGVMECKPQLDARIAQVAENWTMGRMAPTDRNVLRLGVFELLHTDAPLRVVIDEAIELARKFGAAQSPQFVNGILDRLVPPDKKDADGPAPAES
jgi:N utilization substance protein B